jgi:hypothetical protein
MARLRRRLPIPGIRAVQEWGVPRQNALGTRLVAFLLFGLASFVVLGAVILLRSATYNDDAMSRHLQGTLPSKCGFWVLCFRLSLNACVVVAVLPPYRALFYVLHEYVSFSGFLAQ